MLCSARVGPKFPRGIVLDSPMDAWVPEGVYTKVRSHPVMHRLSAVADQVFQHEAEKQAALRMGDDDGIGSDVLRLEHEFQVFLQQPLSLPTALRPANEIVLARCAAVLSGGSLPRTFH